MIQQQTTLKAADNSGAKTVKCIKVLGGFKRKVAKLGDVIIVSVQNLRNKSKKTSKVKKREVYKAIITKTKTKYRNNSGFFLSFNESAVALISKQGNPIGTRILSPLPRAIKKKNSKKFVNISSGII